MLQRIRDDTLKKSAVFRNFGFHHFLVVKRPLMPVRMQLDVDAGSCEAAQLLFIHNLEQVLPFNLMKRDVECRRQFLQKLEAIARRQRRAEMLRRFFGHIGLNARIRCALAEQRLGGDYGASHLILLVVGLLVVGARRLAHLRYVTNDPLFARLCGLTRLPSDRTVVNWLKQFTQTSLRALVRLNSELLYEQIEQLKLPRLTIDLDGTVICTGAKVAWAARGFNPHHRKAPSYYPLLAHLAQTGQILRLKNRPGNVHDSKGAEVFLSQLLAELRARFGRALPLELRMDAAFPKKPHFPSPRGPL